MLQHLDTMIAFAAVMLGISIVVTALTQMINATFGLRGRSLLWGLETLLKQADPSFKQHARQIADKILKHPLLSHTGRRRATAIRREEFVDLFKEVMSQTGTPAGSGSQSEPSPSNPKSGAAANPALIQGKLKAPTEYLKMFERWFDSVMDRAGERFALRSRWVTVGIAAVLAFALHFDAIALLKKLSTDTELRASLVQSTNTLLNHANEVIVASSEVYSEAIRRLQVNAQEARQFSNPPAFTSSAAAESWIRAQISDTNRAQSVLAKYRDLLQVVLKEKVGRLATVADSVRIDLSKTRFVLIPEPYPGWHYSFREVVGIVLASILLSLGAPFWYNVLKNLASLRPRVAGIVQKEREPQKTESLVSETT